MLRGIVYFCLCEICLLAGGYMFFPQWMSDNAALVFGFSLALLFAFMCHDNWPEIVARFQKFRWVSQDDGLKIFRDNIDDRGQLAGMIDFWEGSKEGLFLQYMREGLNDGVVRATGIPRNGLKRLRVPTPVNNRTVEDTTSDHTVTGSDDRVYEDLRFDRWSVSSYAKAIEASDAKPEAGPRDGQD